jgi:hypothetical protein
VKTSSRFGQNFAFAMIEYVMNEFAQMFDQWPHRMGFVGPWFKQCFCKVLLQGEPHMFRESRPDDVNTSTRHTMEQS